MSRRKLITSIRLMLKVATTMYLFKVLMLTKLHFLTTKKIKNPIDTTIKDGQLTINDNNSKLDSTSKKHINFFELKDLINLSSAIDQEVRKQTHYY